MAKLTVLELVQDILNDIDAETVNSINDTEESLQAVQIVKTVFDAMIANRNWPHLKTITQLTSLADTSTPTKMVVQDSIKEVVSVRYNKRKLTDTKDKYQLVQWLEPDIFLEKVNQRDSAATNIQVVTDYGLTKLNIRNDKAPDWYTSFDETHVVMDSFDSAVDTTLQASKTQVVAYTSADFVMQDSAIPNLPTEAFPALLAEAKSTAFVVIKQDANQKVEAVAQRQNRWLSRKAWRIHGGIRRPDYGRKQSLPQRQTNPQFEKD